MRKTTNETHYGPWLAGDSGNYDLPVRFDRTDGYVGISQKDDAATTERVLLTPRQVRALRAFIQARRKPRA